MLPVFLKELAVTFVSAGAEALAKLVLRKIDDDRGEAGEPLPYKTIEHQRAQERASIAASKAAQR